MRSQCSKPSYSSRRSACRAGERVALIGAGQPRTLQHGDHARETVPRSANAASWWLLAVALGSAKLPALAGSLALIATTWMLAREVAGKPAAWFAAVLVALPPAY